MKKYFLLFCFYFLLCMVAFGQSDSTQKVTVSLYGFVRNYFTYDSRKTYTVVGGEYNMLPYDEQWNHSQEYCDRAGIERVDLNAVPQAQLQALTTRVGLNIDGPSIWGARSSGKMEADFGGFGTTNTVLRLRLAYIKLNWANERGVRHDLLLGQDWHPLSGDIMPEVLGMAAGAPFRAHSRTPQLRYTFMYGRLGFTAAALYQLQYMYNGPSYIDGKWTSVSSVSFAHNAIVPELFVGVQYRDDHFYSQLGGTCQTLRPRQFGNGYYFSIHNEFITFPVDEILTTVTPTFYFQYTQNKLATKFRLIFANNTSHLNQLNGYGVVKNDDGRWKYAPLQAAIGYFNIAYGHRYRANLFLGYMKNLGLGEEHALCNFSSDPYYDEPIYRIYMKGGDSFTHLNSACRVAPSISYNLPHFNFGIEYEWTACSFGNLAQDGSIYINDHLHWVANHRICLLVKYNF